VENGGVRNVIMRKLATARRVYETRGVVGVAIETLTNLLPRRIASRWRRKDHWSVGKLVELMGNVVRVENCQFSVNSPAISTPLKTRFLFDNYEKPERELLSTYLDPLRPVVEFGGGIGVIACLANKRLVSPEHHVVVEADPNLVRLLAENRDRNGCRFKILHGALAYGSESVTFYQETTFLASGVKHATDRFMTVPAITLREVVEQNGFQHVTLICDVEGAEIDLVSYEQDCLRETVNTFLLEVHPLIVGANTVEEMRLKLQSLGFALVSDHPTVWVLQNRYLH